MNACGAGKSAAQRGVALAMLLWFVAAMSLLVGTIAMQARVDIRLAQLHAERARAAAAADGAIQLALAAMLSPEWQETRVPGRPFRVNYRVGELPVAIYAVPLGGLIDLNRAPPELLGRLFASVDGVAQGAALELAAGVIEWRSAQGGATESVTEEATARAADSGVMRHARFEAIEDLLLVPGIDRQIFAAVRDSVYVAQQGGEGVDWVAAPSGVLQVLGDLSEERAGELAAAAQESQEAIAPAELDLSFQQSGDLGNLRVDAVVTVGAQTFLRRRWVNRGTSGADGLPWEFARTEPLRAAPAGAARSTSKDAADARR